MKNLISLFTLSTLLFFASCSKEALIEPQALAATDTENVDRILTNDSKIVEPLITTASARGGGIDVVVGSQASTFTVLNIDFTSSHDFTGANLEATQTIDFTDGSGNIVNLTFGVNSYTGGNGTLDISFAIGGNNLTGLEMKTAQIIVDEIIIN